MPVEAPTAERPPFSAAVGRGSAAGAGGKGAAARWAGQGRGSVGFKSRCPLAPLCCGQQHIPVHLRRRSSLPLRQPRLAIRRSAAGLPERPLAASVAAAAAGRPVRTVGCADTTSDPVRLWAPRRAPSSAILRRAAWDNAAMVRRDRLRRWVLPAEPRGGVAGPTLCWCRYHPGAARGKILSEGGCAAGLKTGRVARTQDCFQW